MLFRKVVSGILMVVLSIVGGQNVLNAVVPVSKEEETFLEILSAAYRVSCREAESLRKYYLEDAEIINNGRQVTLDETIKELKQSFSSLTGLTCNYEPKVRARRFGRELAYIVVRESIHLSAHEMGEQDIQQICTYIFVRRTDDWKIAHDHCSSIPGLMV